MTSNPATANAFALSPSVNIKVHSLVVLAVLEEEEEEEDFVVFRPA